MHTTHIDSDIFSRVNDLPLCKSERQRAIAYMQDGEHLAEFCSSALAGIRSGTGHALSSLAHGVKAVFAKPARH